MSERGDLIIALRRASATLVGMIPIFKLQPSIRLAERLLKGRPAKSEPGLIEKWCGQDLSRSESMIGGATSDTTRKLTGDGRQWL